MSELEWRGLVYQVTDQGLGRLLSEETLAIYCGFDPTASSLTTGHLLQMLTLSRLQRAGHRAIAVAGGGTGLIGDPSGRETERPLLSDDELAANVENIRKQLEGFIDLSGDRGQLVNNADWLRGLKLTDFLREIGKHFSVNMMISKESVRARLESREQGISFTEFSYMLLQAYDFLHLFDNHGCRMQIGGSDQWGNITAGVELIRRVRGETAYGLTTPLIVLGEGRKMSKSEGTAVWLDPNLTSPYHFYQYWINTADADVEMFLKFYTFLEEGMIDDLASSAKNDPSGREAQRRLAWEITGLVHGEAEAEGARRAAEALFAEDISDLDEKTLLEVLEEAPATTLPVARLGQVRLADLMAEIGLVPSKGAARTDISSGGAYLNNRRETDPERTIERSDLLHGRHLLLRRGKKNYHLVRFE